MYMMELADSMNFYAIGFSHVSPIEDCLQNCECLSQFRPKLWNTMGIAGKGKTGLVVHTESTGSLFNMLYYGMQQMLMLGCSVI